MYKNTSGRSDASRRLEKEVKKVKKLYFKDNKSMRQIAKLYDTNIGVVQYFFKIYGVKTRDKFDRPPFRKEETLKIWKDKDKIEKMYVEKRLYMREIADIYGVSEASISKLFAIENIKRDRTYRRHYRQTDVWKHSKKIIDIYENEYMSCLEISKRYNCANNTIKRLLKKNGIAIRRYSKPKKTAEAWNNVDTIIRLHHNTKQSVNQIGTRFKVSNATIKNILKDNNAFKPMR